MHLERAAEQLHVRLTYSSARKARHAVRHLADMSMMTEWSLFTEPTHSPLKLPWWLCIVERGLGKGSTEQAERAVVTPWSLDWSRVIHKGCHAFMNINITSRIIFSRSMNTENGFASTTQHAHDPKKRSRQPDMGTIRQTRANHSRNKCLYSKSADHI
jgi:hypothetical protein